MTIQDLKENQDLQKTAREWYWLTKNDNVIAGSECDDEALIQALKRRIKFYKEFSGAKIGIAETEVRVEKERVDGTHNVDVYKIISTNGHEQLVLNNNLGRETS